MIIFWTDRIIRPEFTARTRNRKKNEFSLIPHCSADVYTNNHFDIYRKSEIFVRFFFRHRYRVYLCVRRRVFVISLHVNCFATIR